MASQNSETTAKRRRVVHPTVSARSVMYCAPSSGKSDLQRQSKSQILDSESLNSNESSDHKLVDSAVSLKTCSPGVMYADASVPYHQRIETDSDSVKILSGEPDDAEFSSEEAAPLISDTLESTVRQAQNGSASAFSRLVQHYQARIRGFLFRYLRCKATVDDVAQETFILAYRDLSSLKNLTQFESWLYQIAKNKALNALRTRQRRAKNEVSVGNAVELEFVDSRVGSLEHHELDVERARKASLAKCLSKLPNASAELIKSHYFDQKNIAELARELDRKSGTLRMKIKRIREKLADCIRAQLQLFVSVHAVESQVSTLDANQSPSGTAETKIQNRESANPDISAK